MKAATADLARDYLAGLSLLTLARKYQLSVSAVRYRLKRAGITMRRPGARRGNTNARRKEDVHDDMRPAAAQPGRHADPG